MRHGGKLTYYRLTAQTSVMPAPAFYYYRTAEAAVRAWKLSHPALLYKVLRLDLCEAKDEAEWERITRVAGDRDEQGGGEEEEDEEETRRRRSSGACPECGSLSPWRCGCNCEECGEPVEECLCEDDEEDDEEGEETRR